MSDSEDDWFDKDIDDFVVDIQDKLPIEDLSLSDEQNLHFQGGPSNQFFDADYGGNYNKSSATGNASKSKQNSNNKSINDTETRHVQPISYKKLSFILELTPLNVFLEIIQPDSGFIETINRGSVSYEVIALTLKAIANILSLPLTEHSKGFLKQIFEAKNYWKQIESYMKELTTNNSAGGGGGGGGGGSGHQKSLKDKKKLIISPNSESEFWQHLCFLCRHMVVYHKIDDSFFDKAIKYICDSKHEKRFNKFKLEFEQIQKLCQKSDQQNNQIYPILSELLTNEQENVKPNIIDGKYTNVQDYLDVHLSLIREDFISPLRDGITEFRLDAGVGLERSNTNVRYYPKVRILIKEKMSLTQRNFKNEQLMVDLEPESREDSVATNSTTSNSSGGGGGGGERSDGNPQQYSKKLMFGSLLVLTTSHKFEDLILAVVSNRDPELLQQGFIQIEILKTENMPLLFEKDFIMLESEIFFEPYHQVYRVLNKFTEDTFPMKRYIIDVDGSPQYPTYVSSTAKTIYSHRKYALDIKDTTKWPTAQQIKLNENQFVAYRTALTNQFSLIQGPPGTGKTYIGLQILTTLLKNTDEQILVICYTNHALDQFLTGVLQFTEDIVRMGNQSKNEQLDRFNIKQLNENGVTDKRIKNCFYKVKLEYAELMERMEELHSKMDTKGVEKKMLDIHERLRSVSRKQEELKQISEYNTLKSKRVIGMTSTCAAKCNTLLHLLKTPIVIIEEAAELLESHIVTSITKDTQHLILIGDHQQLRPTTSVYKLAKFYKMDISLFERMIRNGVNSVQLNIQHRMRPEIANLIRPSIYENLKDDESVEKYTPLVGVDKNLYFIDHEHPETSEADELSKKNLFEAQYLVGLCNYLIMQGYAPEDVTILTAYNGQMFLFSQERKKFANLRKVRITVVDNYQGEECKIILLSLVRSNDENKIGYLALRNRVCVALSRAKEGFFLIGNMNVLAKNIQIWRDIKQTLTEQNAIGPDLVLRCQSHNNLSVIKQPSDFDSVKFGGCSENCNAQLDCGHYCTYICHTQMFKHFSNCDCAKNNY